MQPKLSNTTTHSPWYRQVWPWVLISIPFSVIIAMSITLYVSSFFSGTPMVVDEYYKAGRGINVEVAKVVAAQRQQIEFELVIDGNDFVLRYISGKPEQLTALSVEFYHATLAERDQQQTITANAQQAFRGQLPTPIAGKWTITVRPFDDSWRLTQTVQLPTSEPVRLRPLTYGV